jgi:hypothetical protein
MRRILLAGLALPLFIAPALSQTAQPGGSTATMPPTASGSAAVPAPMAAPMTPPGGTTALVPAAPGSAVLPMTAPAPTAMMPVPKVTTPTATTTTAATGAATATGGAPGANSFTEGQAKSRLEKEGYTAVSGLTKDADGIWRGTAMKNAKSVSVGVDYKGNISGG